MIGAIFDNVTPPEHTVSDIPMTYIVKPLHQKPATIKITETTVKNTEKKKRKNNSKEYIHKNHLEIKIVLL